MPLPSSLEERPWYLHGSPPLSSYSPLENHHRRLSPPPRRPSTPPLPSSSFSAYGDRDRDLEHHHRDREHPREYHEDHHRAYSGSPVKPETLSPYRMERDRMERDRIERERIERDRYERPSGYPDERRRDDRRLFAPPIPPPSFPPPPLRDPVLPPSYASRVGLRDKERERGRDIGDRRRDSYYAPSHAKMFYPPY